MEADGNTTWSKHIQLGNKTSECNRLFEFLADSLEPLPVTEEFKNDLKLVAEELLANIINHGHGNRTDTSIDVELAVDGSSVHITYTDSAMAYNPLEHKTPDVLNDLSEGGMGLMLVKSLTDEQHYRRDNNHNVLTVTKNYNK